MIQIFLHKPIMNCRLIQRKVFSTNIQKIKQFIIDWKQMNEASKPIPDPEGAKPRIKLKE